MPESDPFEDRLIATLDAAQRTIDENQKTQDALKYEIRTLRSEVVASVGDLRLMIDALKPANDSSQISAIQELKNDIDLWRKQTKSVAINEQDRLKISDTVVTAIERMPIRHWVWTLFGRPTFFLAGGITVFLLLSIDSRPLSAFIASRFFG